MKQVMERAELKRFDDPDETREIPKGRVDLVHIAGDVIGRLILEPGWRWSTSVKPIVKTKSCQESHLQYQLSGVLKVRMDDGTEFECHAGDVSFLPPGHDGWVVGDEPVVLVDFQGMKKYAVQRE
ncbi:MAG: cupin domain-containing protein [Planctomycetaceae bacterium]|nr:cupin domain-containing protein [Planctomycetaceae bacterium]